MANECICYLWVWEGWGASEWSVGCCDRPHVLLNAVTVHVCIALLQQSRLDLPFPRIPFTAL